MRSHYECSNCEYGSAILPNLMSKIIFIDRPISLLKQLSWNDNVGTQQNISKDLPHLINRIFQIISIYIVSLQFFVERSDISLERFRTRFLFNIFLDNSNIT